MYKKLSLIKQENTISDNDDTLNFDLKTYKTLLSQNCHQIIDPYKNNRFIYLGDFTSAKDFTYLKQNQIKTVITVSGTLNIRYSPDQQIKHYVFDINDREDENIEKFFKSGYEAIEQGLHHGSVLVHCAAGVSRSTSIVICYLMQKFNWKLEKSLKYVQSKRIVASPNAGFTQQLQNFENNLFFQKKF